MKMLAGKSVHDFASWLENLHKRKFNVCKVFCLDIVQMVFEGMEESGSEGLDDLLVKLKDESWMKV